MKLSKLKLNHSDNMLNDYEMKKIVGGQSARQCSRVFNLPSCAGSCPYESYTVDKYVNNVKKTVTYRRNKVCEGSADQSFVFSCGCEYDKVGWREI